YDIPIAIVENADKLRQKERMFLHVKTETAKEDVAPFSSRGPVAMNWQMKPDLLAPGVQILSTIPGGYEMLNGKSEERRVGKEWREGWGRKEGIHKGNGT